MRNAWRNGIALDSARCFSHAIESSYSAHAWTHRIVRWRVTVKYEYYHPILHVVSAWHQNGREVLYPHSLACRCNTIVTSRVV